MELNKHTNYITEIKEILAQARQKTYAAVNTAMVEAYWLVGKRIVDEEQQGEDRAAYGKEILKTLSTELNAEFGKGFSLTNLQNFRKFYLTFGFWGIEQTASAIFTNQIEQTVSVKSDAEMEKEKTKSKAEESKNLIWRTAFAKLTWSHFERIIRVENEAARNYYLTEAAKHNWSVRTLDRNISTLYYHRLISSQKKELVENEMNEKSAEENQNPDDFIKNPTVLEFLKLPTSKAYTERELEQTLIDNLQQFLLELGKGFSFVARQKHIRTETQDFFIDLVFYNYILKCFVIIELKTTKLNHQDIGQLDMYVRMFDDLETTEGDNPTVGILLCTETDSTIAKYSVLKENKQLFANKYLPYLPSEAELVAEIEREKIIIKQQLGL
jgi:predicted nuclease of restriction endonuclease-like (RecB) superfamily